MDQSSNEPLFELRLDHEAGHHFKESSKWARFLSIVYFVVIGIFLLALAFGANALITTFGQFAGGFEGAAGLLITVIIIVLGILLITTILLYRFATFTKDGIERQDQIMFNKGLQALKNYLIVYGVLTILGIVISLFNMLNSLLNK